MQMNRAAEADSEFRQAVQLDTANMEAAINLGIAIFKIAVFKQGRFRESIPFFERGVASRPRKAKEDCPSTALRARLTMGQSIKSSPRSVRAAGACILRPALQLDQPVGGLG